MTNRIERTDPVISVDDSGFVTLGSYHVTGNAVTGGEWLTASVSQHVNKNGSISATLAFKYIKKKFSTLEKIKLEKRLEKLEEAWEAAMENGQEALSQKILREFTKEAKESAIYAKGFKHYVEAADVNKYKYKIKDGRISDTRFKDYTKVIPPSVLKIKKKAEGLFDDFVIYHYWNEKLENKVAEAQKMSSTEKANMKDPILFGKINETDRLYFIADWEDEFCDLTFDEMVKVVSKNKLTKNPETPYTKS